jgi:carbamoyl-phosphate synthase small subunit
MISGSYHRDRKEGVLVLEDKSVFRGYSFGGPKSVSGEVVFNTGMVGYPESMTDPSYNGQILVLAYPLIGNYGVPSSQFVQGLDSAFESDSIRIEGLIVSDYSFHPSHHNASKSLGDWMEESNVPGLYGVDTRMLIKRLREKGTMAGKLLFEDDRLGFRDLGRENLVDGVSRPDRIVYPGGKKRVAVIDCGCKNSIIRSLIDRGMTVVRVPWNYDLLDEEFDGVVISNGPGDPKMCRETILHVQKLMERNRPIFGICLGHQILALAAGADTYKLKFGHRSQNQPCVEFGSGRCYITSQNHGYGVRTETLPEEWEPWFVNANDGTNEGLRHRSRPFMSVQFHPEAAPGPTDTNYLFDEFIRLLN